MSLEEFKQMWVEAGFALEDLKLNYYKITNDNDGYVSGFYAVIEGDYDFYGQMALFAEATEGWVKFIPDQSECGGSFVVDQEKKAEIIAEREAEALKPTEQDRLEAQALYTALMTDTLLPDEED